MLTKYLYQNSQIREPKTNKKHNLTKKQYLSLKTLSENPHLVIKKADKGSAIVVMNTNDYIREALYQVTNRDNYIALDSDPTEQFCSGIRKVLTSMLEGDIIYDMMTPSNSLMCPKPEQEDFTCYLRFTSLTYLVDPYVAVTNILLKTSAGLWIEYHIQKYVVDLPSLVRDTQHFVKQIKVLGDYQKENPRHTRCLLLIHVYSKPKSNQCYLRTCKERP